jgi:hypothetical protein
MIKITLDDHDRQQLETTFKTIAVCATTAKP